MSLICFIGWFPLPVVPSGDVPNSSWDILTKSDHPPTRVNDPIPLGFFNSQMESDTKNGKYYWRYDVTHGDGDTLFSLEI